MSMAATLDLRELEIRGDWHLSPSVHRERARLRQQRVRRIADDIRARVYPVDAERVAASILRRLAS